MLQKSNETWQKAFFFEQDITYFRHGIRLQGKVEHGDESLLDSWLAFLQEVAVDSRSYFLKDYREELGI